MWEIVMRGIKPMQGVRNADVIHRLEAGERLPPPPDTAFTHLYALMLQCWQYEQQARPSIRAVCAQLQ
jgi:hypothetical protein